ncbi:hypothetical protein AVEN_125400-1 [Araneus ventricosus]|uniref:Tc3 transposase DNA binding domain-containing protein n=1 Tax=Araneus ventricosus TaxID=182803 RepID=A0A4Y2LUM0_ARAVE|nr:hypothetical protein AVEN_125400-1 [Araneus ventricosus]
MQITKICNPSASPDAVDNAYIRQQMSDKYIRSYPASEMACFQDLSDFERGVTVGTREMGHSISEVAMKFGFSRTAISRVYRKYWVSDDTEDDKQSDIDKVVVPLETPEASDEKEGNDNILNDDNDDLSCDTASEIEVHSNKEV